MLRFTLEALWAGLKLATVAALVAAIPVAAAGWSSIAKPSWIPAVLLALAVVVLARFGLRAVGPPQRAVVRTRDPAGDREALQGEPVAAKRGAPAAARAPAHDAGRVLRALRLGMDEVSYAPGSPNVLSMTKRLNEEAATDRPGETHRVLSDDARARCSRADDGDETVLAIDGVLDAVTAADVRPDLDALVSERRPSIRLSISLPCGAWTAPGSRRSSACGRAARSSAGPCR